MAKVSQLIQWQKEEEEAACAKEEEEAADAYSHAKRKNERYEDGELAISKNSQTSYFYALEVLKDRFPLGEEAISRSPMFSYLYAIDVIKGKLPKDIHNKMLAAGIQHPNNDWVKGYFHFIGKIQ